MKKPVFTPKDHAFMSAALSLASRGLGRVWPNPAVGCVLTSPDGRVLANGWTQPTGRPHAERVALEKAGEAARGATAYVTLEPCAHQGVSPPCAEALIEAGVRRVVCAMKDPDERVSGRGFARLREAGVTVDVGLMEAEARDLNRGFILNRTMRRPLVTLKVASTMDGRIATSSGQSQWITGNDARVYGHWLRASHDAIALGVGSALADDPLLTCRLPGLAERSPVRVVFDTRARTPADSALAKTAEAPPFWLVTGENADTRALEDRGVRIVRVGADFPGSRLSLPEALRALAELGVTRLLVEGGARLATSFVKERLVDRLVWFRSPGLIGADGLGAIAPFGVKALDEQAFFRRVSSRAVGADVVERYVARDVSDF